MFKKFIISLRNWYLTNIKWRRFSFGKNFHAGRNVFLWAKQELVIGNNCYIGRNSQIECDAVIGDDVLIANNVAFVGKYDHNYQQVGKTICQASQIRDLDYSWYGLKSKVTIEDDVWIGYGAIILSGVTIKTGAIIAAGSIVTTNVDSYSIYAGVPAKKVADRFSTEQDLKQHQEIINV